MNVIVLTFDGFAKTNHALNVASLKVIKKVGTSRLYIEETPANILRKKYLEQDKEGAWTPSQQQGQEMAFTTDPKQVAKLIKEKVTDLANVEAGEVIDLTPEPTKAKEEEKKPAKKQTKKPARKKAGKKKEEVKEEVVEPKKKSTKRKKVAKKVEPKEEEKPAPAKKKVTKKKATKKKAPKKKVVEEYDREVRKEVLMEVDSDLLYDTVDSLDIFPDTDAPSVKDLVEAILDHEEENETLVSFE